MQIQTACGHHNFIVNSPCHWQTRKKLFIGKFHCSFKKKKLIEILTVSDFINSGELYKLIDTYQQLPVELVKLYVAQLSLALGELK